MAKYNELIYSVREDIKEFSDDTEASDRYIGYLWNIKRAKYLRQDLNNFQKTTDLSIQQSMCLALEEVSSHECGFDAFCDKILRTKQPIPKPIELHTNVAITKVKPTNKLSIPFNFITRDKAPFLEFARYNKSIYAFLDTDMHIYVISKADSHRLIECISVTGIFENPLDLSNYSNCCNCDAPDVCYDEYESEYPLQPHYVDLIKREIVQELAATKFTPEDKENNSTDAEYKQ